MHAPRVEDDRVLGGHARYVADLVRPGMVEAAIVRSTEPHARIAVQPQGARRAPGVVAAVSAADLTEVPTLPELVSWARPVGRSILARDRVRYVGAPIAAVVAPDRYLAEDAAELVEVDYTPLPAVLTLDEALAPGAPRLYDDWPDNLQVDVPAGEEGRLAAVAAAFAAAERVVAGRFMTGRHAAVPMESRGCLAEPADRGLVLWSSTQVPYWVRAVVCQVLPIAERDLRVIAPDVGGGFGGKWHVYPEELLVCWLALRLGRPVRWIEDRAEHLVASCHARDAVYDLEAATDRAGRILAVRGTITQDVGSAEIYPVGFGPAFTGLGGLLGPYRIPHLQVGVRAVVTNKTPSGAYRGYGIPEAQFAMERLLDRCAQAAGADPVWLRRELLLRPDELPHRTASGAVYDSGRYREAFDDVLDRGRERLQRARAAVTDPAVRVGMAAASFVEGTGATAFGDTGLWGAQDSVTLRFDPGGGVTVSAGVTTTGQGVRSMLATLAAEALGVAVTDVRVVIGDTGTAPYGLGGWASRSTIVAAGAIERAAGPLRAKGLRIAAHLLEASAQDVVLEGGAFHVVGAPERAVGWSAVATTAYLRSQDLPPGEDPGLESGAGYIPPGVQHEPGPDGGMNASPVYANGGVAAVVAVDVETGGVRVLDYVVAHDCGRLINPTIVEGQIHGGMLQGIGGALLEDLPYDPAGQPLATTFMDYVLPTATEAPRCHVRHFESPSPFTAFGVKGAGEAGTIGAATVIAGAIEDALGQPASAAVRATPVTPATVWRLAHDGIARPGRSRDGALPG